MSPDRYECSYCLKAFNRKAKLEEHLRTHTNERPFACAGCDKTFVTARKRDQHAKQHEPDGARIPCPDCGVYMSETSITRHRKEWCRVLGRPDGRRKADAAASSSDEDCSSRSCSSSRVRSPSPPASASLTPKGQGIRTLVVCEECNMGVPRVKALLIAHMNELHGGYKCPHCPKRFENTDKRRSHIASQHGGEVICPVCGVKYANRSSLCTHMKRAHSGSNPGIDCLCGATLQDAKNLERHQQSSACPLFRKRAREGSCSEEGDFERVASDVASGPPSEGSSPTPKRGVYTGAVIAHICGTTVQEVRAWAQKQVKKEEEVETSGITSVVR